MSQEVKMTTYNSSAHVIICESWVGYVNIKARCNWNGVLKLLM